MKNTLSTERLSRPILALVVAGLTASGLLAGCSAPGTGSSDAQVLTAEQQQALAPAEVVEALKEGNRRFVAGTPTRFDYLAQARATAENGQFPKAVVLSCLDSRIPPEIVFDQGIGDIFVGRVAGNFENVDMLGSMEFATAAAGARAIVVLGHSACGAVKGAADGVELGNLTATLENILPAVEAARASGLEGELNSGNAAFVDAITKENVRQTVADITGRSEILRQRVADGQLVVVGGIYDLATGEVRWLD
jgi:carbonic anhydrase